MDFWDRNFRPLEKGSLRGVVVMWIRMTLGVGVLTLPYYLSIYGYAFGALLIVLAGLINLRSFYNIFAASDQFQEKNYLNLIEHTLGGSIFRVFKVTFFLDQSSSFILQIIVCWNLFQFMMFALGMVPDEWFIDRDKMRFDEANPDLTRVRGGFMLGLFLVSVPFLLQRSLHAIQKVTILLLFLLLTLLSFVIVQAPWFFNANSDSSRIPVKSFSPSWPESFFAILLSFYVQPFVFSLREELLFPSKERMNKVARITMGSEIVICTVVALAGYMSLGEKYITNFFLVRKPYSGESALLEAFYCAIVGIFFLFNSLGIAIFNPTMRDYLYQTLRLESGRITYVFTSLAPFFVFCLFSFLKPSIIDMFNWSGMTVCSFNGYIVPGLMRIQVIRAQKGSLFSLALEITQIGLVAALVALGVYFKVVGASTTGISP